MDCLRIFFVGVDMLPIFQRLLLCFFAGDAGSKPVNGPSLREVRQNLRFKGGIQRIRPDLVLSAGVRAISYCIPILLREEIVLVGESR